MSAVATTKCNRALCAFKIRQTLFLKRNRIIFERRNEDNLPHFNWHLGGELKLPHRFIESRRTKDPISQNMSPKIAAPQRINYLGGLSSANM